MSAAFMRKHFETIAMYLAVKLERCCLKKSFFTSK